MRTFRTRLPKGILLREFAVYRIHFLILQHDICRKASKIIPYVRIRYDLSWQLNDCAKIVSCQLQSHIQMNFDKLKNLFSRSISSTQQQSFFDKAASIISSSRRSTTQNTTAQFQEYLQSLPIQEIKAMKIAKIKPTKIASLRPQLVVRCYQNVPRLYFDVRYSINNQFFTRNRKEVVQKTTKMYQHLDQVELCLFNQISSRFDQILSVLRTIESLECLVDYNSQKLKEIRRNNVTVVKNASQRNIKIVRLLKKQERLKVVLQKMGQMRHYANFIHLDGTNLKLQRSNSQQYQQINEIRLRRDLYFQLNCTKKFEEKVQELQSTLKRSYSDSINDAFFKYVIEIFPYDANFWDRKLIGKLIFEEEQHQEGQGTVILDESMLVQEQAGGFNIRLSDQREKQIVSNVVTGWREGEYSTGNIKAAIDKFIKQKHLRFNSDCRNFCFQAYLKEDKPKIDNPNLVNLMQQMNIFFATKTSVFYADIYRSLLSRSFSLANKIITGMFKESNSQLSIQQKQKISIVVDGFFSILAFIFKTVYEKIIETIDLKHIHDSMELSDFKQLINLFQTQEDFIAKHIKRYVQFQPIKTFLDPVLKNSQSRIDFQLVRRTKEQKVLSFLNRTHRYILQNQLRESFQNQIWTATDIPTFYYDSLHYLITGQSLNLRRNKNHTIRHNISNNFQSSMFIDRLGREQSMVVQKQFIGNFRIIRNEIIINNKVYKVTQTLLLLLEIVQDYMHLAQFYPFAKKEVGQKIFELLRAYNTSSHQLIILGGAVKLQKIKTKNITAKHLALNSLCLSFLVYIIDCIKNRVPINDQERIRTDLQNHDETTIKKLSTILSGKVAQAVGDINLVNVPSKGTQSIVNSTKILHDILVDFYQKDILSRIFVRQNVAAYLTRLKAIQISTKIQAQSLKDDLNFYFHELRFLQNLIPDYQRLRLQAEDIVRVKFQQL